MIRDQMIYALYLNMQSKEIYCKKLKRIKKNKKLLNNNKYGKLWYI
jgi:hypothetical protein